MKVHLGLPPRKCQVSPHAVERYRERFGEANDPAAVLRNHFNKAKPAQHVACRGMVGFWVDAEADMLIVAKRMNARFVILTCLRLSQLDNPKWEKVLRKFVRPSDPRSSGSRRPRLSVSHVAVLAARHALDGLGRKARNEACELAGVDLKGEDGERYRCAREAAMLAVRWYQLGK